MGNCCDRCFRSDKRKYLRTRYNVERDFSIEFENLMDDDPPVQPDTKCQLQLGGPFTVSSYMRWLVKQEEDLRMEEDAYYEGREEQMVQTTRLHGSSKKEHGKKYIGLRCKRTTKKYEGDDESELIGQYGEDEFEKFLQSVHERSLAARTRALSTSVPFDAASDASSRDQEDISKTEMSSIDLEWEHEAGMNLTAGGKPKGVTDQFLELAGKGANEEDNLSNDYEWDNDFGSGENESETLLSKSYLDGADRR